MYRRAAVALTGLILLSASFGPTGSGATGFASPPGDLAVAPPPQPPTMADRIAALLRRPGLTPDMREELLLGFGQVARLQPSPAAIREVIRWLEYDSKLARRFHEKGGINLMKGSDLVSDPRADFPAVKALAAVGPPTAPMLVDEYLACFEKSDPSGATSRDWARKQKRRCMVAITLSYNREIARAAVEEALRRMTDEPKNDHVQQACTDLIKGVVVMFDPHEQPQLFPPAALELFPPTPPAK